MKFTKNLSIREQSKHRKEGKSAKKQDCVLRAISLACDIPYDEIWETQIPYGFCEEMALEHIAKLRGIKYERVQTIFKGQKRKMVAKDFGAEHTYILRQANHWVALVKGELIDTFDSSHRAVYYAIKITK